MVIVGGKDYYDNGLAYGRDPLVRLVRNTEKTLPVETFPTFDLLHEEEQIVIVYFCGKRYCGYKLPPSDPKYPFKNNIAWDYKTARPYDGSRSQFFWKPGSSATTAVQDFMSHQGSENERDILIQLGIAIAVFSNIPRVTRSSDWNINPSNLGAINFQKVKSSVEAFQELSMWIGGVLADHSTSSQKPVEETIRIEKRGFDPKWSFRKEKKE